jgi:hypothetical protein
MTDTLIISETKLRQFTDLNNNVDTELLRNAVREAQDIEIQRILGTLLYDSIMNQIDAGPSWTTPAYETLVNDYIQSSLIYWAYYYAQEDIYIRTRNNGMLIPTGGDNSVNVERDMYNVRRQSTKNKAEFYSEKLTNYIITNTNLFPETQQTTELYQQLPDFGVQYSSPIVFANSGYAPHLRGAIDAGIPLSDSRFPYLPPPNQSTKRVK